MKYLPPIEPYRWHYLAPYDRPRPPWPIIVTLDTQHTRPPRPFAKAQAKAFHGLRDFHGFVRGTIGVRFHF